MMGIIAASIPASGIPVAGGIVFVPLLTVAGVCPRDAIVFTAATQTLGVGVFAPLNWFVAKPQVFDADVLWLAVPFSLLGDYVALRFVPVSNDRTVILAFASFCVFMAFYTAHGLYTNHFVSVTRTRSGNNIAETVSSPGTPNSGQGAKPTNLDQFKGGREPAAAKRIDRLMITLLSFFGGMLTAYIGVGIEKARHLRRISSHTCPPLIATLLHRCPQLIAAPALFSSLFCSHPHRQIDPVH